MIAVLDHQDGPIVPGGNQKLPGLTIHGITAKNVFQCPNGSVVSLTGCPEILGFASDGGPDVQGGGEGDEVFDDLGMIADEASVQFDGFDLDRGCAVELAAYCEDPGDVRQGPSQLPLEAGNLRLAPDQLPPLGDRLAKRGLRLVVSSDSGTRGPPSVLRSDASESRNFTTSG